MTSGLGSAAKLTYKPHSVSCDQDGDHLSSLGVTAKVQRLTRRSNETSSLSRLLSLAPGGVCLAAAVTSDAGALLPHRFTLARGACRGQYASLLHYAVGSPRLAVSQHRALWSGDFPHSGQPKRDRPVNLTAVIYYTTPPTHPVPSGGDCSVPAGNNPSGTPPSRTAKSSRMASIAIS